MIQAGGYRNRSLAKTVDWWLVACWVVLVLIGWANIYASIHSTDPSSIFDWSCRSGKQFVWIMTSVGIAGLILFVIPPRVYEGLSVPIYLFVLLLLVAVIFRGIEVKGSGPGLHSDLSVSSLPKYPRYPLPCCWPPS